MHFHPLLLFVSSALLLVSAQSTHGLYVSQRLFPAHAQQLSFSLNEDYKSPTDLRNDSYVISRPVLAIKSLSLGIHQVRWSLGMQWKPDWRTGVYDVNRKFQGCIATWLILPMSTYTGLLTVVYMSLHLPPAAKTTHCWLEHCPLALPFQYVSAASFILTKLTWRSL